MTLRNGRSGALALAALAALISGCGDEVVPLPAASTDHPAPWDPSSPYDPGLDPGTLATEVTNPLFPAPVGARWVYEGRTEEGLEHIEVEVLDETREVWGATATVVRDTVQLDGELIEDTWDWYAQDEEGNVWYLGEDSREYEGGAEVSRSGSWEAGVDSALPGIIMLASPRLGVAYREEYLAGEAEDLGEVVGLDQTVTVAAGTFTGCVRTRELSAVERDVEEFKVACPGLGVVLEEEDGERIELIDYEGLPGQ